eukprot:TRINITY_DN359_c0_g1_i3.p1 TRINITY_DN359_c0_g1~~TRINITY_DN359_c0_g1_i3.p1  ORF type:complete len:274 (+),score=34.88 TRINITY_DN359_c0_g1_i3:112-933(+)
MAAILVHDYPDFLSSGGIGKPSSPETPLTPQKLTYADQTSKGAVLQGQTPLSLEVALRELQNALETIAQLESKVAFLSSTNVALQAENEELHLVVEDMTIDMAGLQDALGSCMRQRDEIVNELEVSVEHCRGALEEIVHLDQAYRAVQEVNKQLVLHLQISSTKLDRSIVTVERIMWDAVREVEEMHWNFEEISSQMNQPGVYTLKQQLTTAPLETALSIMEETAEAAVSCLSAVSGHYSIFPNEPVDDLLYSHVHRDIYEPIVDIVQHHLHV